MSDWGKTLGTKSAVQIDFYEIAFHFHPPFDYGNGYFDNDNGQTLFLDGILVDIMEDNGENLVSQ